MTNANKGNPRCTDLAKISMSIFRKLVIMNLSKNKLFYPSVESPEPKSPNVRLLIKIFINKL